MAKTETKSTPATPATPAPAAVQHGWGVLPTTEAEVPAFIAQRLSMYESTGQIPNCPAERIAQLLNKANKAARAAGRDLPVPTRRPLTRYDVASRFGVTL